MKTFLNIIVLLVIFSGISEARRFDDESGLQYFRARYYSDELGRFVSRDKIGYADGLNLYRGYFVPNGVDPFGLDYNGPYDLDIRYRVGRYGHGAFQMGIDVPEFSCDREGNISLGSALNYGATSGGLADFSDSDPLALINDEGNSMTITYSNSFRNPPSLTGLYYARGITNFAAGLINRWAGAFSSALNALGTNPFDEWVLMTISAECECEGNEFTPNIDTNIEFSRNSVGNEWGVDYYDEEFRRYIWIDEGNRTSSLGLFEVL